MQRRDVDGLDLEGIWQKAMPIAESVYLMTDSDRFREHLDLCDCLRRAISSTMCCLRDAVDAPRNGMTGAYLAVAAVKLEEAEEKTREALGKALLQQEDFDQFATRSRDLSDALHGALNELPPESRDPVVMNSYQTMCASKRFLGCV